MQKMWVVSCIVLAAVICLVGLTACQCGSRTSDTNVVTNCPVCNGPLRVVADKDVSYTKCICANCKKVTGPYVPDEQRLYLGISANDMVHVCDHCKAIVGMCPGCRKAK